MASSTTGQAAAWSRQVLFLHTRALNVHPLLPGQVQQTLAHTCGPLQLVLPAEASTFVGEQAHLT